MHVLVAALHRPNKPTGVCRHAVNLAHALIEQPKVSKVSLIVGTWQSNYFLTDLNLNAEQVQIVKVDLKRNAISRNLWFLFGLPKLANSMQADIVHLSFPLPFVRLLFRCPVVATIHDLYPYEEPKNFGYPSVLFNQLFLKQCVSNSHGLVCVSQCTLKSLNRYFPSVSKSKPTTYIYNYVDFPETKSHAPEKISAVSIQPFLLTVAQHRKNKNLDLLIKAYAGLLQSGDLPKETNLILVGNSGPETESIHQLINDFGLSEQIILLSSIQDSQLLWLYKNCKLLIIPSSSEGFCLPLAEGITCGCQVVCSDIPIFRELDFPQCTYFSLQSKALNNLKTAILTSIQKTNQAKTSIYAEQRFSKQHIGKQYADFYSKLLKCQH